MRKLAVYFNEHKSGILTEKDPGRNYIFTYEHDYLIKDFPAISLTLPKRKEPYQSNNLFPFFTNLLPEGANRKVICAKRHIDENDLFGILTVIANNDFIGAVHLKTITND